MPQTICPKCGREAAVDESVLGKRCRCPACREVFVAMETLPQPVEVPAAVPRAGIPRSWFVAVAAVAAANLLATCVTAVIAVSALRRESHWRIDTEGRLATELEIAAPSFVGVTEDGTVLAELSGSSMWGYLELWKDGQPVLQASKGEISLEALAARKRVFAPEVETFGLTTVTLRNDAERAAYKGTRWGAPGMDPRRALELAREAAKLAPILAD
jgi:hypothetical protein